MQREWGQKRPQKVNGTRRPRPRCVLCGDGWAASPNQQKEPPQGFSLISDELAGR